MIAANDPAWQQWDAALTRVKTAADALRALSGQSSEKQRDDAEDELEEAMDALDKAADKITSDDDDDDD